MTARVANSPSAPMSSMSSGAAAYMTTPMAAAAATMSRQAQLKIPQASRCCPRPRQTDMGTAEPPPTRSASAKLIMMNGMARLMAAKAVSPRYWPTSMPSIVW